MTEYVIERPLRRAPTHPGAILREDVLPALGLTVSEAARRIGVSRQQLHRVLSETHPISTEMALRIARLENNRPDLWLRMQQAYDLWHTEKRLQDDLKKIEPILADESRPSV